MLRLAALYALFAAFSIAVNIATQVSVIAILEHGWAIPASILAGTATGLVAKYVLDKRWIFSHVSSGRLHEARTFILYAAAGVLTTLVFWGTEYLFHLLFRSDAMRYLGGVLGLAVGYAIKYRLDKHFVFTGARA
ncbi:GtrA family protein [Luteimonas saliphila]|uniref:GtrA family protein n=1 Tax=Luteimonas saliphila TaxID=2804919 RepID=UPI00192D5B1D